MHARAALTVVELVLVCTLAGLLAGIVLPRASGAIDAIRLRQAGFEVSGAITLARAAAIRRADYARVVIDATRNEVRVESGRDTLFRRDLGAMHRVALRASRDTITFAPSGLGYGISNSAIVLSIGERADTVVVSRLGRMRMTN